MRTRLTAVVAVLAAVGVAVSAGGASAAPPFDVVASGLDNPRGLAFGRDGFLYVAEAGRGGPGPCGPATGAGPNVCFGATGAITRISRFGAFQVVRGLPSIAPPGGERATGPTDVSFWGPWGYTPIGCGCIPAERAAFGPAAAALGRLIRFHPHSRLWGPIADLVEYEATANPDRLGINANPYSVLARDSHRYVVDAGGNDLIDVLASHPIAGRTHTLSTVAVFPARLVAPPPFLGLPPGATIPMEAVPDSIAEGPDGALYVGQLTGFPFPPGAANVFRVDPLTGERTTFRTGFTTIIDIAFGEDGSLYVLEFQQNGLLSDDPTGALIRVAPNGARTTIASTGLILPGGLAIEDGFAYVSNFSVSPGGGEVVRIPL